MSCADTQQSSLMKILHTSDWHLGHTLYGHDRTAEQSCFLDQLARIVAQEKPDAMVVSGDVYHTSSPSATTQRLYTDAMLRIHNAYPPMAIVVLAGNHDSCSKLEVSSNLWKLAGLSVIGGIELDDNKRPRLSKHIIRVNGSDNKPAGYVVAVPHTYPQNYPSVADETPRDDRQRAFFQALLDEVKKDNTLGLPVALAAHLTVGDGKLRDHEDAVVGGLEAASIESLGTGYDYLALGHIHCPQNIACDKATIRYCGSPLAVSFDEDFTHSVTIVNLETGQKPQINTVDINNPIPLVTLPTLPLPINDALSALAMWPDDKLAYIRLNVLIEHTLEAGSHERALEAVKGKNCLFCHIKAERKNTHTAQNQPEISVDEIRTMQPIEIAKLYYQEKNGTEMSEELQALMLEACRQVDADNQK